MIECETLEAAAAVPGVVHVEAGSPVKAYVQGDDLPDHLLIAAPTPADVVWDAIKAERDRRKLEGGYKVAVGGVDKWFHSDTFSRTQQIGLVLLGASVPSGLQWKTMDGSFVTMTQTLAGQVFAAAAAQDQALFARAEALRADVLAAADPSTVDVTAGWPATYEA